MSKPLLIIFIKNPQLGRVKTRLAKSIGDEKALQVYRFLLRHTREVVLPLEFEKIVYYSAFVEERDDWDAGEFLKGKQRGNNLGQRMEQAFEVGFKHGYGPIGIIGSDCIELCTEILNLAFHWLESTPAVLGPASDGGYYFLGMEKMIPGIFNNVSWSTSSVMEETIQHLDNKELTYQLLPTLNDIDELDDLERIPNWQEKL